VTTVIVVAVDGPAAAGKGTLARRLSGALGLPYLDTGLLYRAVGRRVLDAGADPSALEAALLAARALQPADLERRDLRGPEADAASSAVAAIPDVRGALLDFQRNFAAEKGAVLDGRDIGTVVFPDAALKLFVTANPEARARRRWLELRARGEPVELPQVLQEMLVRDARDSSRAVAPLRAAADAVTLDTTAMTTEEAFQAALTIARDHGIVRG
jgi:cytidylate kinase